MFQIKIKRGLSTDLTKAGAELGELKFTTDTNRIYVGNGTNNIEFPNATDLAVKSAVSVSATGTSTNIASYITIDGVEYKIFPDGLTKSDVGLGNVDNTSDANKPISTATQTALNGKLDTTLKGANSGLAELDSSGKVPSSQLPSYVDDVLEFPTRNDFPATGETGKIYIALDTNKTYRWSGTTYVEIGSSLALGETSSTAYRGDRGKTAYDHSQLTSGNPHNVSKADVGLGNVDNTSDIDKPISTATQTALDTKQDTLVSGTNIKTVNGNSLVGSGDVQMDNVFWCTYNVTTHTEITTAISSGKLPACFVNGYLFVLVYNNPSSETYTFACTNSTSHRRLTCTTNNVWGSSSSTFEAASNRVTSISASSTDKQYPSAKCMYNYHDTTKQDVLTAGSNVQIADNVISATDTTYTAGTGISIVDNVISNTQTSAEWGNIGGTLSNQTDLQNALDGKVAINNAITGATKCKITYDSKGLVTDGADLVAGDIPDLSSVYYPVSNPNGYISGITSAMVITALGYTPYNSANFTAANIVSTLGNNAVNRATADANGNVISTTYATKTELSTKLTAVLEDE